jgi:hypothetical protein
VTDPLRLGVHARLISTRARNTLDLVLSSIDVSVGFSYTIDIVSRSPSVSFSARDHLLDKEQLKTTTIWTLLQSIMDALLFMQRVCYQATLHAICYGRLHEPL